MADETWTTPSGEVVRDAVECPPCDGHGDCPGCDGDGGCHMCAFTGVCFMCCGTGELVVSRLASRLASLVPAVPEGPADLGDRESLLLAVTAVPEGRREDGPMTFMDLAKERLAGSIQAGRDVRAAGVRELTPNEEADQILATLSAAGLVPWPAALASLPAVPSEGEREGEVARLMDGMELAWGLIANANEGDWDAATPEWKAAAERWRDECWHPALDRRPPTTRSETEEVNDGD